MVCRAQDIAFAYLDDTLIAGPDQKICLIELCFLGGRLNQQMVALNT